MRFPSLARLSQDRGIIGQLLRDIPGHILAEAQKKPEPWTWLADWTSTNPVQKLFEMSTELQARRVQQLESIGFRKTAPGVYAASNAAERLGGLREVRFLDHIRNPAKFYELRIMRTAYPSYFRKTLLAAASQREAFVQLGEIALGGSTVASRWWGKMLETARKGDKAGAWRATRKVIAVICRIREGRKWLFKDKRLSPEFRKRARQIYDELYARDRRRYGKRKADAKWKSDGIVRLRRETASDKVAVEVTEGWLRRRGQAPGYCFCSDPVLINEMRTALNLHALETDFVKKIRRRLGLKKAHIVFVLKEGRIQKLPFDKSVRD